MAKRLSQKVVETTDTFQRLRATLGKCTKSDLVALLVELAQADHGVLRQLDARFELNTPPHELVAATRRAITVATAFDERYANYNFHYDHAAYEEVKRNLTRLIKLTQVTERFLKPAFYSAFGARKSFGIGHFSAKVDVVEIIRVTLLQKINNRRIIRGQMSYPARIDQCSGKNH